MTQRVYSVDVRIVGTVYVKANSRNQAIGKVRGFKLSGIEVSDGQGDIPISGAMFDSPELPDISLSPAMTIHDPLPGSCEVVWGNAPEEGS